MEWWLNKKLVMQHPFSLSSSFPQIRLICYIVRKNMCWCLALVMFVQKLTWWVMFTFSVTSFLGLFGRAPSEAERELEQAERHFSAPPVLAQKGSVPHISVSRSGHAGERLVQLRLLRRVVRSAALSTTSFVTTPIPLSSSPPAADVKVSRGSPYLFFLYFRFKFVSFTSTKSRIRVSSWDHSHAL
jgi:hypothetical protein